MVVIYNLMDKGEAKLTAAERKKLAEMSVCWNIFETKAAGNAIFASEQF